MEELPEIILVDKPKGITSYDVIRLLKHTLPRGTKIGHAGTLDPLASGLMIIGIGRGTKRLTEFLKLPKVYTADVLLGRRTSTGDLEGEVLEERPLTSQSLSDWDVRKTVAGMCGTLELQVPAYSAVKVGGQPLYKRARRGDTSITPPIKTMQVARAELLEHFAHEHGYVLRVEFAVGSGTYIRSLAEELGRRFNLPATLADLRRTIIGEFRIEDARPMENFHS
ncbi:MAG: tRNA pseudouridine(55) synthase TruB [Candidatus Vogelbacteria bacterium CG10_big_fil_rev_8_21_14_0_10_51_16]|uniref:tRNA pseudouridine synthase B n=1 Tax=Candidatus Vogelbacteria bacterium CG10_big_fil_rev_8_21_14_0_10_51_16 TaxID=1975045 RepID=A0A2H0RDT3_9BACT|nr:MAG: tRNA pseudouridine(55) synthase TruB [Candidatus Vogelbacteria bacterium CG10_big_fil_rev_8_21_14_0_10_51_16]